MINQIFMSKSGMFAFQRKLQTIASNISNAQTVGYKRRRTEMESIFPLILEGALTESDEAVGNINKRKKYAEYGSGVRVVEVSKNFEQGTIEVTNQPMDLAIEGHGFFQFRLVDGSIAYSRAGNLHIDFEGNIVNPNGQPLEPAISIPRNATEVIINEEGRVFVQIAGQTTPQEIGQVLLASFQNAGGLKEIGQNLYLETASSGQPNFETPAQNGMGSIRQRALEFSNVNVIEEMMEMIITQRTFELIVKSIQSGEAMLKASSDLGK
jgi:flagellar basal-body rod protein FlgG